MRILADGNISRGCVAAFVTVNYFAKRVFCVSCVLQGKRERERVRTFLICGQFTRCRFITFSPSRRDFSLRAFGIFIRFRPFTFVFCDSRSCTRFSTTPGLRKIALARRFSIALQCTSLSLLFLVPRINLRSVS